jgi:hypothetical protein
MERIRVQKIHRSEEEIAQVFEDLRLEDQEQREAVLKNKGLQNDTGSDKPRYLIRLSNSTNAAPVA